MTSYGVSKTITQIAISGNSRAIFIQCDRCLSFILSRQIPVTALKMTHTKLKFVRSMHTERPRFSDPRANCST